jgi:uncharacterized protein
MATANLNHTIQPEFQILIDGTPLPVGAIPYVMSVMVEGDTELPSMFAIELAGTEGNHQNIPWIDDPLFSIGNVVEVKMGYVKDIESLIIGEITSLEPEFSFDRLPSLIVRGYDRRHRLQRGTKTRTFIQQKDSDIASQIASAAGLTAKVTDSRVVHEYVIQVEQTDMEFLQERAKRLHYEILVQDKTLHFRPVAHTESARFTLTLNDELLEFYPRLSAHHQVSEVAVRGWNTQDKKARIGKGQDLVKMGGTIAGTTLVEKAFGKAIEGMSRSPTSTQAETDQLATARFKAMSLQFIIGDGMCWGRTDLQPGTVVKLKGLGTRFSGDYYVVSARHLYGLDIGYKTHFTVRRTGL